MCLHSKSKRFKYLIAEEDIICYKSLIRWKSEDDALRSEHYNYHYIPDVIQPNVKLVESFLEVWEGFRDFEEWRITDGYHSYIEVPDDDPSYVIAEFVIPKGTRYTKGKINQSDVIDGYVSETIKLTKVVRGDNRGTWDEWL